MSLNLKSKWFFIVVGISCFLFLFSGLCPAKTVTLTVTNTEMDPDSIKRVQEVIAEFEKLHPNVKVEMQNIDQAKIIERSMAAAMAGETLGVELTWAEAAYLNASRGLLEPLDDVIDAMGRDDFVKSALLTYKGNLYMVPYLKTGYVLYYREDILKEKGLQPPMTWDELLNVAKACTEDLDGDGKIDRYGIVFPAGKTYATPSFFMAFAYTNGGSIMDREGNLSWNSKPIKETLEFYRKLKQYAPPGITGTTWAEQIAYYHTEAVAMSLYPGRLLQRTNRFNPDLIPVTKALNIPSPTGDPTKRVTVSEVAGMAIMKGVEDLDIAKEFIKFFISGENHIKWCQTVPAQYIPARKSTINNPKYWDEPLLKKTKDTVEIIVEASKAGKFPLFEWEGKVNVETNSLYMGSTVLAECIQEVIATDQDIQKILDKYEGKIERELKKIRRAMKE